MADPIVVAGLKDKPHELRQAIVTYEERLDRTRKEPAVVTATLTIMERDNGRIRDARPAAIRNLFSRREPLRLCKEALADEPEMTTVRTLETVVRRGEMVKIDRRILRRRGGSWDRRLTEDACYKDRGRRTHPSWTGVASETVLTEAAVLLAGLAAMAWVTVTNRRAWARYDTEVGTSDNTDFHRSMMQERYRAGDGGYAGDGGSDSGGGFCGGDGGGGCH